MWGRWFGKRCERGDELVEEFEGGFTDGIEISYKACGDGSWYLEATGLDGKGRR